MRRRYEHRVELRARIAVRARDILPRSRVLASAAVAHARFSDEETMVLTKPELIASLQHEVRILQHLASKVEPTMRDYRPTPKQRSVLELLQYMTIMGPQLVKAVTGGGFDVPRWMEAEAAAKARDFDQTVKELEGQSEIYASGLGAITDEQFREEIEMFGRKMSRGSFIVNMILGGHAAYRTQLFLYLKSCGRDELNTMNLWAGMDAPMATT